MEVVVVEGSDEVKSEGETTPAVAIGFFQNTKDLEPANDMLGEDTHCSHATVMSFLLLAKGFATPALMRCAASGVELGHALEAAVGV